MTKLYKTLIGVGVVAIGLGWWLLGLGQDFWGTQGKEILPEEAINVFQQEMIDRALAKGPHPVEGFDALILLGRFSSLQEADFDGVETGGLEQEGVYALDRGELIWKRISDQVITTAERTVNKEGYGTLLANLSKRLGQPVTSGAEVMAIIQVIDDGREGEIVTYIERGLSFQQPRTLTAQYIETVDWPPQIKFLDESFTCVEAGEETDRAGGTRERRVDDRVYCVTTVAEGAAGSVYRQYAYAFPFNGQTVIFTFSLRYPQCGNYEEEGRVECERERETFDLDGVVDLMAQSVKRI